MTTVASLVLLGALLLVASYLDLRTRRIPNWLVLAGSCGALLLALLPGGIGLAAWSGGFAAGLAIMLPFHLLRVMGAGDVKLMAAVGAVVGYPSVAGAALATLVAGGVLAFVWAARTVGTRTLLENLRTGLGMSLARVACGGMPQVSDVPVSAARMPYALAVAAGTAAYVALVHVRAATWF